VVSLSNVVQEKDQLFKSSSNYRSALQCIESCHISQVQFWKNQQISVYLEYLVFR
jgi:hypothetical protein